MAHNGRTDYDEIQTDEIEALKSIFLDDFTEQEARAGAWNKRADRAFSLSLRSTSHEELGLSVTISVELPTTYPKSAPRCKLYYSDAVSEKARKTIDTLLQSKLKQTAGREIIFEIADSIKDELDQVAFKMVKVEKVPTLVEERAAQQALAKQREDELEAEELERQKSAQEEEARALERLVESTIAKRKKKSFSRELTNFSFASVPFNADASFDQVIKLRNREGVVKEFNAIAKKTKWRVGPVTTVYTARSADAEEEATISLDSGAEPDIDTGDLPFLVLKECFIITGSPSRKLNSSIESLESNLRSLLELPLHNGVCNLVAFSLEKFHTAWNVKILMPLAERGSLRDFLEINGPLSPSHLKAWTIQILDGLDFLHRHRIVHGRINPDNILIERTDTGTMLKLSDALFQQELHALQNASEKFSSAPSAYWIAPEAANNFAEPASTKDVWDLGVVFLQMAFGLDVQKQYNSPSSLVEGMELSEAFEDLVNQLFKTNSKKRPLPFTLLAAEFLRNDKAALEESKSGELSRSISAMSIGGTRREKRDSMHASMRMSRYANDFIEVGRLGKGGFGEVVRARNKLDGTIYAIKKITQESKSALSGVLSEVMLLSRLNNPFIVRYYTAWIEEEGVGRRPSVSDLDSSTIEDTLSHVSKSRTQELDFISSKGYPDIQFGYDSDEEEEEAIDSIVDAIDEAVEDNSEDVAPIPEPDMRRRRSSAMPIKVTLYIQMEHCERQTLRDLIRDNLHNKDKECWRLFRQVLEGLAYIHSNSVIHRDLKPENIFISLDQSNTVRIGDFGLARPGEAAARLEVKGFTDPRLTASIGTSVYVAPEVKSSGGGSYNEKADMYSLGIILFEMSYPVKTGMERAHILEDLRKQHSKLPMDFNKPLNEEIINLLIRHKVSERPSSQELLQSGKIPSDAEDDKNVQSALRSLSDKSSPLYAKFIKSLFSQAEEDSAANYTYEVDIDLKYGAQDLVLQNQIQHQLVGVFSRHGAVRLQRPKLLPFSPQYYDDAAHFLNSTGHAVQLPFDLTLPFARILAKHSSGSIAHKSYTFGSVFRESQDGLHPQMHGEVDFDIVSENSFDLALREAEVIKVIDEILDCTPSLADANAFYQIGHSEILNAILRFCKIPEEKYVDVKSVLSRLNIGTWTWTKVKAKLRTPEIAVPATCLEDLSRFDFRSPYGPAIQKLRSILRNTEELESTFRHVEAVVTYLGRFQIKRDILINPLTSKNERFYRGNIMFQCVYRVAIKKKLLNQMLCAGGRYDQLIQEQRGASRSIAKHAVGFNLSWIHLVNSMAAYQSEAGKQFLKKTEESTASIVKKIRCDVLVDSVDTSLLRSTGIQIVQELWAHDISAELVIDTNLRETKSHHQQGRDETTSHEWMVLIKQDGVVRVRSMITKEDVEIRTMELVGWIRSEMKEREGSEMTKSKTHHKDSTDILNDREADVAVLVSVNRGKKTNRRNIVEDAQSRTYELSQSFRDSPIVAVEMKDETFDGLYNTRLSDPDSWRQFIQGAPHTERQYLGQLHDLLLERAAAVNGNTAKGRRSCWVYNFRTRACMLYDLGKAADK